MYSQIEMEAQRKYFIEDRSKASIFQWLTSKGTNYTCYVNYINSLDKEGELNNEIDVIRTIIYALHKPLQFTFFYWTLLIFILHKFNFKKPVMKIILVHFILRSLGDIINKFGDLMPRYYATSKTVTEKGQDSYGCQYNSPSPEMHPLKWVLTRQIGCIFWCLGEIVADWYPLLRTKAVCKEKKNIRMVYVTCGIFNFFKVLLIIYHFTLSPSKLYNEEGVYDKKKIDLFYFNYWLIQLAIIYTSAIYDGSVYIVLKKNFDKMNYTQFGFIGKFKTISEYRILVSAIVCAIFLPIISVTIILKYYYYLRYDYHNLEFSFDEIRQSINNVQYFMIFIDQILLFQSKNEASVEVSRPKSSMILGNGSKNDIYRSRSIIKNMSNINFSNNNNSVYDFKNQYNTNYIPKFNPSPSNDSINMNNVYSNIYSNSNININNSENLYNYNFNSSNETIIKIENNNEEKSQKSGSSESTIYYFNS